MSDERKRVKDLAVELNLSAKDVLAAAKELGITTAKVAASSLSETESSRLRGHFSPSAGAEKQEVIVRRRRRSPEGEADSVSEDAGLPGQAAAPAKPEEDAKAAPEERKPPTAARIVHLPGKGPAKDEPASQPMARAVEAPAPAATDMKTDTPVRGEAEQAGADSDAFGSVSSDAARPGTPSSMDAESRPHARTDVHSEPHPETGPEVKHEVNAEISPEARPDAKPDARPRAATESGSKPLSDAQTSGKARKVESPARASVISRPAPARSESAKPEASASESSREGAPKKIMARVVRPAAFSAEPERGADGQTVSSAPALPPKSEHSGEYDASYEGAPRQHRRDGDRADSPSTSQVRVISRPDAPQPRGRAQDSQRPVPRTDGRPDNRSDRPQGARPDNRADGRTDTRTDGRSDSRPGGYAPRPGMSGPGGRGPGAPGTQRPPAGAPGTQRPPTGAPGTQRPPAGAPGSRPGGYAPRPGGTAPGGFPPASTDSEQGRKKRQKGRRTVEFGTDTRARGSDEDIGWNKSSRRGKGRKSREIAPMGGTQPVKAAKRKIKVDEFIRVSDLAHQMQLKSSEIIKVLFNLGVMATINQSLDVDTATLVASEFDYEIEKVGFSEQEIIDAQQDQEAERPEDMVTRPPVVTIMGHVDHGKTSLLDAIRKSSVVSGEAGGITQHIGAYHVKTKRGEIVFLDTPGHEAFTAMRARGAEVTDIVVLVVAADDGVMEQTKEAINHSRAAKVPIMVAVNKMDKEAANPDRVKRELADQGLVAEDWGGDTTFSYVSAKTRLGLDDLLELLALQAEILELKANPKRSAMGHIVEAKLDKGRGSLGTVLIQHGTLRLGDAFVCGIHSGRVRAMFNDQGKKVKEAGPSMPVEVQGFEGVPEAGEEFICIADDKSARRIAESRALKQRERELAKESKITLETFLSRRADSVEAAVLNLVVKSDVQGSLEAITDALHKLATDKVRINIIHGGTGAISESDVLLSTASNAIIIGFNVRPSVKAKELAEQEKVDIRFYDIIYKLVEEIKSAMEGMLAPVSREVFLGTAEVRETFSVPKIGTVAGCHVSDGKMQRNAQARLLRNGIVVHTGKLGSLRRFKDDVREVTKGYECGLGLENYNDVKVGDVIEAFEVVEEAATL